MPDGSSSAPVTTSYESYLQFSSDSAGATSAFVEAYANRFAADIQAGVDQRTATRNALIDAHFAQEQAFLSMSAASDSITDPAWRSAALDAAVHARNQALALQNATGLIDQQLADYVSLNQANAASILGASPQVASRVANGLGWLGDGVQVGSAVASGDGGQILEAIASVALGALGAALAVALLPAAATALVVGAAAFLGGALLGASTELVDDDTWDEWADNIGDWFEDAWYDTSKWWGDRWDEVSDSVGDFFDRARNWVQRVDPLVLDLDGDGIESISANGSVLFDHDGDGISNSTGWIGADDGILVLDRNGNGLIDDGTELFGNHTEGSALGLNEVTDRTAGLRALDNLDTNHDGRFDSADAQYGAVRVWRDLNQDGVSQSTELFTLSALGIASINLNPTSTADVNLGNGNVADSSGTFTRVDGTSGVIADLLLGSNNFYREFDDHIEITDEARDLPNVRGSGMVRDLVEAASLDEDLASAIAGLAPGISRDEMMSRMDDILALWAGTSEMETTARRVLGTGATSFSVFGNGPTQDLSEIVSILERFNGSQFFNQNADGSLSANGRTYLSAIDPNAGGSAGYLFNITLDAAPTQLLLDSYEQLRESVYAGLVLRTRLAGYLDAITVTFDDSGISFDTSGVGASLEALRLTNAVHAYQDLIDLVRYGGPVIQRTGWRGNEILQAWIAESRQTTEGLALLQQVGVVLLSSGTVLTDESDIVAGTSGADIIQAQGGSDIIFGESGNDTLYGGGGNDVLSGGAGNDYLSGDAGNDTYVFGRGDGQDTIAPDMDPTAGKFNVVEFGADVAPSDIVATRVNDSLVLRIAGTTDTLTINYFFYSDTLDHTYNPIQQVRFADGTTWDIAALANLVFAGTAGVDTIRGSTAADTLSGQAGNDILYGAAGNDTLNGGEGNDSLYGEAGNDVLSGGAGNDYLSGDAGNDTYVFGRGSGVDQINNYDLSSVGDVLLFDSGIEAEQLWFSRSGNDLVVEIIGTSDRVSISSWYSGASYQLDEFRTSDGRVLTASEVNGLVSAMAAYSAPANGQTTLPESYATNLLPVIAANW